MNIVILLDIIKYDIYRGPNIGLYTRVNDSFVFVPNGFAQTKAEKLANYLKVEYVYASIANTRLIGTLMVANDNGILLPKTAYDSEYEHLKKETKMNIGVLDSRYTALGNVICANNHGAIVSPWISKENIKVIQDVLGVETFQKRIAGYNQVGAMAVTNDSGSVIHPETDEEDIKKFAKILKTNIEPATINNGIPFVASGVLANNHSVVVGTLTTGPEIMMFTRAFLN